MPSYLSVVLPLALLISVLFSLGKLHRYNEFTAMRAAGFGLFRITPVIWLMGLVCCGLSLYLSAQLMPWSVESSNVIAEILKFCNKAKAVVYEQCDLHIFVYFVIQLLISMV